MVCVNLNLHENWNSVNTKSQLKTIPGTWLELTFFFTDADTWTWKLLDISNDELVRGKTQVFYISTELR